MKFLKETQDLSLSPCQGHHSPEQFAHRLPFEFVIPETLISAHSDVAPEYLKLLPSIKEGPTMQGPTSGQVYMRPMVTYDLTATAIHLSSREQCRSIQEIMVMPSNPAEPPLQTEHFPREYRLTCSKTLRQHFWSRSIGTMTISAVEPAPLNISTSDLRASTSVPIKLLFKPCKANKSMALPYDWDIAFTSFLRIRTFNSTRPFSRMPTQELTETDHLVQMDCKGTLPESRHCDAFPWRLHRLSPVGTIIHDEATVPWTTTLIVPVNAAKSLIPTFLSPLSARRYSLVLQFIIGTLSHGPVNLEIPIQVVNDVSEKTLLRSNLSDRHRSSVSQTPEDAIASISLEDANEQSSPRAAKPPPYSKH